MSLLSYHLASPRLPSSNSFQPFSVSTVLPDFSFYLSRFLFRTPTSLMILTCSTIVYSLPPRPLRFSTVLSSRFLYFTPTSENLYFTDFCCLPLVGTICRKQYFLVPSSRFSSLPFPFSLLDHVSVSNDFLIVRSPFDLPFPVLFLPFPFYPLNLYFSFVFLIFLLSPP